MNPNKKSCQIASRLVGAGLCLLAILGVCYLIAFPMRAVYNADYADTLSWAKASVDARALFSHDFNYACLLPFGGQLLMVPFVALFGFSYTAHACGMILFFLLLTLALGLFFKSLGANAFWTGLSLFCVVGALCSSEKLREVYFGHILYYSLGGLFLVVGLSLAVSLCKNDGEKPLLSQWFAFCAWCVLCSTDGLTSLSLFILPLCAALAFERLCDRSVKFFSLENMRRSIPLLCAIGGAGAGTVLGALLRNGYSAPYQEAFSTFSATTDWPDNLLLFFSSFLEMFAGPVALYAPFASFKGVVTALRLGFGLLVMAAPLVALFFWKTLHHGEKRLLVAHFTVSATMLFAFVFGLLSNAPWRLSPMLFTSLLVTICLVRRLALTSFFKRFALLALVVCVLIAGLGLFDVAKMKPNDKPAGSAADLADYLQQHGFTYGYSTFWNANAITVLSGDTVKCRGIDISEETGLLSAGYYQNEPSWYYGQGDDETYFLLLSDGEYGGVAESIKDAATATQQYNGYVILSMPHDLFPRAVEES